MILPLNEGELTKETAYLFLVLLDLISLDFETNDERTSASVHALQQEQKTDTHSRIARSCGVIFVPLLDA